MIEARGGKDPYVYMVKAHMDERRGVDVRTGHSHSWMMDVADSTEEAEGRAMRACRLVYPEADGWQGHFVMVKSLAGIDWVGRHDLSKIRASERIFKS